MYAWIDGELTLTRTIPKPPVALGRPQDELPDEMLSNKAGFLRSLSLLDDDRGYLKSLMRK